ncbi:PTS sugar transporter subunit IIA [Rossellomorea oryzaecorticis]|uniref:PTS sugar transporter subunit IIA n=1 Tax=Rossellomorea oryzaecorticis TaxID=1396505 RepID=A0ABW8VSH1_9BACI
MFFDKEVSLFNRNFKDREEVIAELVSRMEEKELVTNEYKQSVIEREREFPTGLQTLPFGIAIPHADSENVLQTQIGFASLENPVEFKAMGSNEPVQVKLIFLLAIKNPNDHLDTLQKLIGIFQSEHLVNSFSACSSQDELNNVLEAAGLM